MEQEIEIWKDIIGYEGLYMISNLGNVKSLGKLGSGSNINDKILKLSKLKNGYIFISLSKDKRVKQFLVHRLVGLMFIDNPLNKEQINHIDGIKSNNNVNNLEWNTSSENHKHRFKVLNHKGNMFGKYGKENPKSIKINQFDKQNNFIKTWYSIIDVKKELNIDNSSIVKVCKGKIKTAGGFIWKYTK